MKDPNVVLEETSKYVMSNLKAGLREIISFQDEGILNDGVVRNTVLMLQDGIPASHCIPLAINLFTGAGIRAYVNDSGHSY